MNKFKQLWSNLVSSLWFLPVLIVGVSIILAVTLIEADSVGSNRWLARWPRLFDTGVEGARGMLSMIAASMMSVVGVTFSMTLMTLALASSQYTSRILRDFMRSHSTQAVLGAFAGIFTYCLIVLRTIRGGNEGAFVPSMAVFFGFVLALGGVGALMFFIHHIATSIQASSIIASVAQETIAAVDRIFPEKLGEGMVDESEEQAPFLLATQSWQTVSARRHGYIQSVDNVRLMSLARDRKTIIRMERGIGQFVVRNTALASLALEEPPDQETIAALQAAFSISIHRMIEQDLAFGIRQIVDMALKALSPSINDTTTAAMCLDYLTAILARLASRNNPSSHRCDDGQLRVIAIGPNFEGLLVESFDQIRSNAKGNVAILLQMLGSIQTIAGFTADTGRRRALRDQVQRVAEMAERTVESAHDSARINAQIARARGTLED